MGKPSRLSKQGNQLMVPTASRDNHVIPSVLGCSHRTVFIFHFEFSAGNLSSEGGRAKQESDVTAVMQNTSTRGDGDVLHHVSKGVGGKSTLDAHCFIERIRACVSPLGPHMMPRRLQAEPCDGQAGESTQHLSWSSSPPIRNHRAPPPFPARSICVLLLVLLQCLSVLNEEVLEESGCSPFLNRRELCKNNVFLIQLQSNNQPRLMTSSDVQQSEMRLQTSCWCFIQMWKSHTQSRSMFWATGRHSHVHPIFVYCIGMPQQGKQRKKHSSYEFYPTLHN